MKLAVFDLDGTLLYTLIDINDAINYALKKNNITENTLLQTRQFVGNGAKNLVMRSIHKKYDITNCIKDNFFDKVYSDYEEKYSSISLNKTKPFDGIVSVLKDLKQRGYYLAVLSNKDELDTINIINHYFNNIFDVVHGFRKGYRLKPDPKSLLEIIKELNVKIDDTFYIGDSLVDLRTAKNAKVKLVSASYGYCDYSILKENNPDFIIKKPSDILNILV